jgi:hypothetical protein
MEVWIVVQQISYPNTGPGGEPMLNVTHEVMPFTGGDCKFGAGFEVVGIFESEHAANAYVADLAANGVILYDAPVPIKDGELPEGQQPTLRVFLMLEELHRRGYEQLRLVPGMSGTGLAYRSSITPAVNVCVAHGALAVDHSLVAAHTSANGKALFGWDDAAESSIAELARMFIRRCPKMARLGRAPDPSYVRWFREALAFARRGAFPVAYDSESCGRIIRSENRCYLPTIGDGIGRLPMPPPGLPPEPFKGAFISM